MTSESKLEESVKTIIAQQLKVDKSKVVSAAKFTEDLGADSLDTVELVMALEEQFNIEIPDEDAQEIKTVQDAIDYARAKTVAGTES